MKPSNLWQNCTTKGLTLVMAALLSGCQSYQFTLNDSVVRSPAPLYTDFRVTDKNLQTCLDQAIKDSRATNPADLKQLNCSHAGIKTLEGLQVFHRLEQINLSHNELTRIEALGQMGRIKVLLLNDNALVSASEILTLPQLQHLNIDDNPELECADTEQLKQIHSGELQLPEHCR